ncbi:MAG: sensor histidine kinase [Lachnospiraceae bacterium]|nr:sensor histidine kinase [Lachnospiraceae bacterium]
MAVFFLNVLLFAMILGRKVSDIYFRSGQRIIDVHFYHGKNIGDARLVFQFKGDASETIYLLKLLDQYFLPAFILILFELMFLISGCLRIAKIRRKLKPLNDLAIKTEEISRGSFDMSKVENLEAAITHMNPDEIDVGVHTGDKDLQSIEVALNNLLRQMKESERRQARFVSDASHELRTPIAVIQGYVNMLDRWGKNDEEVLEESIEALKNETSHMKELVDQLLFLARGDNGRNKMNMEQIDLSMILQEVWEESEMIDTKHKYDFAQGSELFITGDFAMIKQCMRIFIQNAEKYSPENTTIKLSAGEVEGYAFFRIQDEGIGMEEKDVSHIFERFYRADSDRNSETGGSGLGLSIAKWIVDAHNGNIEVLTRPELGTRFTVKFPKSRVND